MRYCADTWFILGVFGRDERHTKIIEEAKHGKSHLIIPMIVLAESTKKLLQHGVPQTEIDTFWQGVENSEKVSLIPIDRSIAKEAAKVSLSFNLPLIDSLVAATGKLTECHALLSADSDYGLLAKKRYVKVQGW